MQILNLQFGHTVDKYGIVSGCNYFYYVSLNWVNDGNDALVPECSLLVASTSP